MTEIYLDDRALSSPAIWSPYMPIVPQLFAGAGGGARLNTDRINAGLMYLHESGGGTMRLPYVPGSGGYYDLSDTLHCGGNVAIICDPGVILRRLHNNSMLDNSLGLTNQGGYPNSDITLQGGVWDGNGRQHYDAYNHFSIGRCAKLRVFGIEALDGVRAHAIDISAVEDVFVDDCRFMGFSHLQSSPDGYGTSSDTLGADRKYAEAIQLDHNTELSFSFGLRDGTHARRVIARGCYFGPNEYAEPDDTFGSWGVGVGAHGSVNGRWADTITTENCVFDRMVYAGVRPFKWRRYIDIGSRFLLGARGVHVTPVSAGFVSANNPDGTPSGQGQAGETISLTGSQFERQSDKSVFVAGPTFADSEDPFYLDGMQITGCTFDGQDTSPEVDGAPRDAAIDIRWVRDFVASGNIMRDVYRGYDLQFVDGATISGDRARDIVREYVWVNESDTWIDKKSLGYTRDINIIGNSVLRTGYSAVNMACAVDGFSIRGMKIVDASQFEATRYGIIASTGAKNGYIDGNEVSGTDGAMLPVNSIYATSTTQNITVGSNKCTAHQGVAVLNNSEGAQVGLVQSKTPGVMQCIYALPAPVQTELGVTAEITVASGTVPANSVGRGFLDIDFSMTFPVSTNDKRVRVKIDGVVVHEQTGNGLDGNGAYRQSVRLWGRSGGVHDIRPRTALNSFGLTSVTTGTTVTIDLTVAKSWEITLEMQSASEQAVLQGVTVCATYMP